MGHKLDDIGKSGDERRYFPHWFLAIGASLVLVSIAWFLINNVEWFKAEAFKNIPNPSDDYRIHVFHMHLSMIKRSIGLFAGFSLMFLGLGVAFYSVKTSTDIEVDAPNITLRLVTASPGIIAVIFGALVLCYTIGSKDKFPGFNGNNGSNSKMIIPPAVTTDKD